MFGWPEYLFSQMKEYKFHNSSDEIASHSSKQEILYYTLINLKNYTHIPFIITYKITLI